MSGDKRLAEACRGLTHDPTATAFDQVVNAFDEFSLITPERQARQNWRRNAEQEIHLGLSLSPLQTVAKCNTPLGANLRDQSLQPATEAIGAGC
jgi:hypothetical protein